ncbi:prepilin-type N-terminal cleavage/methylation domain-containing protein [Wenzhouxiangella sp. AB-CW3]|uniref:prepilin-type N-terminal cleavage/methylation domain-containing protein n=1 Tax=Wenzhouxiangella sp. AB-CW3 TaxID=2771012 RepID=UPI00168A6B45|nr:prepilin-type N-terminal cleavage/methylation domain-containing protein [Wenzhouxiangella sp. AB-CW3]QOC23045.1 prepilin-type N-terminal cleavage/methylation domain-containing protein [Wenzhouxiangella sp. AB-CW3]
MKQLRQMRGFTLIEVMLAISLVALVMAMAYGGFRAAVRASNSGEAIIEENNRLRVVQQFMRRQLSLAQALVIEEEVEGERIRFAGDRDRVRFVSPMPGYLSYGGSYVQELSIEPGVGGGFELVYYYAMLNGYEPGDIEAHDGIVLLENLARGEFHFLGRDFETQETYWSDYWETPEELPLAVAVEIDLDRDHGQVWPDLIAPVMVDAEVSGRPRQIERASDIMIQRRGRQGRRQ